MTTDAAIIIFLEKNKSMYKHEYSRLDAQDVNSFRAWIVILSILLR